MGHVPYQKVTNFFLTSDYPLVEVKNKIYAEITFGALKGVFLWPLFYFYHFCCIPRGRNPMVHDIHPEVTKFFCESVYPLTMPYNKIYDEITFGALAGAFQWPFIDFYHFCCIPRGRNPTVHDIHPEVTKFFCESVYPLTMAYNKIYDEITFGALAGAFLWPFIDFYHFCCIPRGRNPMVHDIHPEATNFFYESIHPLILAYNKTCGKITFMALKGVLLQPPF